MRKPILAGVLLLLTGCGNRDAYPDRTPVSVTGRSARCTQCEKDIASVGSGNLFEFQGVQYTVCDDSCTKALQQSIVHGEFESEGHKH